MNIAAGGVIHDALTDHRVLYTTLRDLTFVIAHVDDRQRAITLAEQADGRAYTVLFTDEQLAEIRAGNPHQDVDVLDAQRGHEPAARQIKVNGAVEIALTTEYGKVGVSAATADDLHAGDLFLAGKYTEDGTGREHGLTIFRALTDFDPETGTVEKHIVTPYWDDAIAADRANLSSTSTYGPDRVVHRVVDRPAFLAVLGLSDLAGADR
jgi:hypothetical protein